MDADELEPEWREYYEERAAIREYEGEQPREQAERDALLETRAARLEALRQDSQTS